MSYPKVAIIGCGISGITAAIELKKLHITNFTIYDRNDGLGGTWKENTYPGCACDITSHLYCSVDALNPNWSRPRAPFDEIRQYWQRIFDKHGLWQRTRYNSNLTRAEWLSESSRWKLTFEDVLTKEEFVDEADIFIAAVGMFSNPLPPTLPGIEQFKGPAFHSARWDHTVNLSGKRVGLVGNGASATQILSSISGDPTTTVVNFVRTPQWYLSEPNAPYWNLRKSLYTYIPGLMRLNRWRLILMWDLFAPAFHLKNRLVREYMERDSIASIKAKTPAKYHDFLIPKYPLGAKRIIIGTEYLDALALPNVELLWDPIEQVTEAGVVLKNGESRKLDVLVLAHGFDTGQLLSAVEVKGLNGQLLSDVWDSKGGAQAYIGSCVSGFPNMFILMGPNTATGHHSILFFTECQLRWQMQVLSRLMRTRALYFDIKPEAEEAYNVWLQDSLKGSVWETAKTKPWYRLPNGKIHALWPGSALHFWWLNLYPKWKDLIFVDAKRSSPTAPAIIGWTTIAVAVTAMAWFGYQGYLL